MNHQIERIKVDFGSDEPIECPDADRYDFAASAERIAEIIQAIESPAGCAVALYGKWGSGKTSFINLVRRKLKVLGEEAEAEAKISVVNFRCWEYRSNEALVTGFLREVAISASPSIKKEIVGIINKLAKHIAGYVGALVNAATCIPGSGAVAENAVRKVEEITERDENVEMLHKSLVNELRKAKGGRILMIIDDIDRFSPDKALTVFELVKTIGRLPNVMYLFAFDPDLIDRAIKSRSEEVEGRQYLDKIIQTGFFIPKPTRKQLVERLRSCLGRTGEGHGQNNFDRKDGSNVFSVVLPVLIKTPRDVYRLDNTLSVTWPAVRGELSYLDFVVTESLRIFRYGLYKKICANGALLVGLPDPVLESKKDAISSDSTVENPFKHLLEGELESDHDGLMMVLGHLFPRVRNFRQKERQKEPGGYDGAVYGGEHFGRYFWTA